MGKRAGLDAGAVCSLRRGEALGSEEGSEAVGAELTVACVDPVTELEAVGRSHREAGITVQGKW